MIERFFHVTELGGGRWQLVAPHNIDQEVFSAPAPEDGPVFDERLRAALIAIRNRSFSK